jgi:MFS family permease
MNTFHAFRSRNYRLFFAGQSVSQIGTWMQRTAVNWVIFSETKSAFWLGASVFASQFPSFLFSLFGGITADRYDRHRILFVTQSASLVQSLLLAAMMLTGNFSLPGLLGLGFFLGTINAFDVPARQPLVHDLITDKADLPNALALNSSMVNLARLAGPALAGAVLHWFGASVCFLINSASFLAVLSSLFFMKLPKKERVPSGKKALAELKEGFEYVRSTPAIYTILLMVMTVSLLIFPYDTLIPVFAKAVYHGDATTFGMISSFMGMGAVAGTFFLASLKKGADLKLILLVNTIVAGVGLICFSQTNWFPLAMMFAIVSGFGVMSQNAIYNTIVQVNADENMRGRVMSFQALSFFGMLPLGSLLIGTVSAHIGAQATMLCQGIAALLVAASFSKFLRRDYLTRREQRKLPETEEQILENY